MFLPCLSTILGNLIRVISSYSRCPLCEFMPHLLYHFVESMGGNDSGMEILEVAFALVLSYEYLIIITFL